MSPGPPEKADEFVPHPVKEQLPGVDFCLTSPPPWRQSLSLRRLLFYFVVDDRVLFLSSIDEALLLAFQHYLVMLGTTVIIPTILVPLMGGGNVSSTFGALPLLFGVAMVFPCR